MFERRPTGGSAWWSEEKRRAVLELCKEYGKRTNHRDASLGYKDSFGLIIFEHGCPDNVPAILWSSSGKWGGLFKHRAIPEEVSRYFSTEEPTSAARQSLASMGQVRLAGGTWLEHADAESKSLILVLAAVGKKLRRLDRMSEFTGLAQSECRRLIELGVKYGLLAAGTYLTPRGLKELNRLKREERAQREIDKQGEPFYYPQSLRGPGKI